MPWNLNNIDLSVSANSIAGIIEAAFTNEQSLQWFDDDLQNILMDTTKLICWAITSDRINQFSNILQPYYPSTYGFYYFTSRCFLLLHSYENLPHTALQQIYEQLQPAMVVVTKWLLSNKQQEGQFIFWEQFLGNADSSYLVFEVHHHEDRVFSTAMSVNTLININTKKVGNDLQWIDSPLLKDIKAAVEGAIKWLSNTIKIKELLPENCFFSATIKNSSEIPFFYPRNVLKDINGQTIKLDADIDIEKHPEIVATMMAGVSGIIEKDEYANMIQQKWFGHKVEQQCKGYNTFPFVYWSSPSLTHSVCALALSKYIIIQK